MKVLVFAPHPDDEVLGCGGTIARYVARGDTVSVCYVTSAYLPDWTEEYLIQKEAEITRSNEILGISKRYDLKYPTVRLDTIPQKEINDSFSAVIADSLPDCVFIPHRGDINRDHRIVHDAALVALRPVSHRCHKILAYETLSETEWGPGISVFEPRYYVDITLTIGMKIAAMEAFGTEMRDSPHPRSRQGIISLSRKRGSEILVEDAEAFIAVRCIEE